jgi:lysozyme
MKYLTTVILSLLLLLTIIALLFYFGILRFNYPSHEEFPVHGLDISHHQKKISWSKIDKNTYAFIFIKATEGGNYVDENYRENITGAKRAGFSVGAYHFFTFRKKGIQQAENFINTVSPKDIDLPPVIDLEYIGNSTDRKSRDALKRELLAYISRIESAYGQKPILYTTYEFYDYYLKGNFYQYPLWIRDIFKRPSDSKINSWLFWQYSNRGNVTGIEEFVDLNVFHGNRNQFQELLQK